MAVWIKNAAYDLGLIRPRGLASPAVCVGNLSVGGSGKTPMVLLLARLLAERGWYVDVLSRGYRRSGRSAVPVRVAGTTDGGAAAEFGDEPTLMARRGLRVFVGADRYRAGVLAEQAEETLFPTSSNQRKLHLLDDGFQHRKLAREVDIVLVRRRDLQDELLPLGNLREPLSSLKRADIVVLRSEEADLRDRVLQLMDQDDPARVWIIDRRVLICADGTPSSSDPLASSAVAFCAIGDPCGFFDGLNQAGLQLAAKFAFRDHHRYTTEDMKTITRAARESGAACFVTTEKDAMRLTENLRLQLESEAPLIVAGLEMQLREESQALATLEALIRDSEVSTPVSAK
jgi:tetraacyldisaccharide 4'-kinase